MNLKMANRSANLISMIFSPPFCNISVLANATMQDISSPVWANVGSGKAPVHYSKAHSSIQWSSCSNSETLPFQCGSLVVPLDYTDPESDQHLVLSLVKLNATKQPSRGSIIMNPGGPGNVGRSMFVGKAGQLFLNYTGGEHDLISFDPRGTGASIPFSCFSNATDRANFGLTVPMSPNASADALETYWSSYEFLSESCHMLQNITGDLVGTAFTARDMMRIVDALDEDGLLRYHGFSYGTVIGATAAAMFPDRIDKMVLDGVLNVHQYYQARYVEGLSSSDAAFQNFFEQCSNAPRSCQLARHGESAAMIASKVDRLLDQVQAETIVLDNSTIVKYGHLKQLMQKGISYTVSTSWPSLAGLFDSLLTRNVTAWKLYSEAIFPTSTNSTSSTANLFPNLGLEAFNGIWCSDSTVRDDNVAASKAVLDDYEHTSRYVGDILSLWSLPCLQWKFTAKGRYAGAFQVHTRSPILMVASPFDPISPLVSAQNVSSGFERSVVLKNNAQGHCSAGQKSSCVIDKVAAYFTRGELPIAGSECYPDAPIFPA